MLGTKLHLENERRKKQWDALLAAGGPKSIAPKTLNDLAIYRGGRGVWFDKNTTADLSGDGAGVAVGVLHTGSSYADDLTDDGVIYHYPSTERAGRDDAEIAALRNAFRLGLPVFVVTHCPSNASRRDVHRGWVTDTDDVSALCLIEFLGESRPAVPIATTAFRLDANREERKQLAKRLKRSARFSFEVGKRCGWRCAVCAIEIQELLDAAHVRGVAEKGSDDPRNGLILCKNHHAAFDKGLLNFHPDTGAVELTAELSMALIAITVNSIPEAIRPHTDALRWRWERWHPAI